MIEVLKSGKYGDSLKKEVTCSECGCVYRYSLADVRSWNAGRFTNCPECCKMNFINN